MGTHVFGALGELARDVVDCPGLGWVDHEDDGVRSGVDVKHGCVQRHQRVLPVLGTAVSLAARAVAQSKLPRRRNLARAAPTRQRAQT